MDRSIESRVNHEVENWLRWITRWRPATHRGRARLCRQCFGSPLIASAGLAVDVPHAVQHALSMRMKIVIDASVDEYTERNLPLLAHELNLSERRESAQAYRPAEGLEPEFRGLDLDPQPAADAPYLFTFSELADRQPPETQPTPLTSPDVAEQGLQPELPAPAPFEPLPPLSPEEKAALKAEMHLADEFATQVGLRVCAQLAHQKPRLLAAIAEFVEPQVQALLADLESTLDSPLWPRNP
ncbi:spermidine/putrescine ABC transporter substrate-binding protein [Cryobacterium sp. PH31-L1]|uniref:spermidine/putrescine ABC transporter substrate-binding protein n=1 Tax=Cryobacterium sp. PH31-L1 TaxID=3046199 RepID=UPI0024B93B2C|nr:spermidine/putrescine ABC transporter substrate-binding protein [Cryobacterium sp. PH31-L1]MDJ0376037.1 spermidine/putrescine ABC transporter substrate-binding protein [Cryobacterium sp. PH31-L1]